jgi:hypothetical protein
MHVGVVTFSQLIVASRTYKRKSVNLTQCKGNPVTLPANVKKG